MRRVVSALLGLLPVYLLIAGLAVWKIRAICLLRRDDCGPAGILETVLADRLVMLASVILVGMLVFLTFHIVARALAGTLDDEEAPPRRRLNVNGLWVSIAVCALYLVGSYIFMMTGAISPNDVNPENVNAFVWTTLGPLYGSAFVFTLLWHLNDYFVKPVSNVVLLLLFAATFASIYLLTRQGF